MKTSARSVALEILFQTLYKQVPLQQLIENDKDLSKLSPRDRAFSRLLITTTLRRMGQLEAITNLAIKKSLPKKQHLVLLLGLAQLIFLKTDPHAAVNESVDLCKQLDNQKFPPVINAVLRKIERNELEISPILDDISLNISPFFKKRWEKNFGKKVVQQISHSLLQEPTLDITVKENPEHWASELGATIIPSGTLRIQKIQHVEKMNGFDGGKWWVQDISASLPVKLLQNTMHLQNKNALDMCAAPGGKTAQLALAGADVTALDISENRMKILQQNMDRLNLKVTTIVNDAKNWETDQLFDVILLDAPCTATGNIRRQPDIMYQKTETDIIRLAALQTKLLEKALTLTKPNGLIIFCTCSIEPEETTTQIDTFLSHHKNVSRLPIKSAEFFELDQCILSSGDVLMLPHQYFEEWGGVGGFFITRLKVNAKD